MANDSNELKNNELCEDKQEARKLTDEDLEQVTGGNTHNRPPAPPSPVAESVKKAVNAALQNW